VEGCVIGDNTFLLARDIAKYGDFAVTWDDANQRALFDTRLPYGADVPTPEAIAAIKGETAAQSQTPALAATPSPAPVSIPASHNVAFAPLRTGDAVKTQHIEKAAASIGGDYKITQDCYETEATRNRAGVNFSDLAYGAALPEWKAEWDNFPAVEVKDPETVRYKSGQNDRLDVYNTYEAERMIRAIYAYAKDEPRLWKDQARTVPNFKIVSEYPPDYGKGWFFPWRGGLCVEGQVKSLSAGGAIHIYALDVYYNGEFKDTEYWCWN
jgi:hypothetical protein